MASAEAGFSRPGAGSCSRASYLAAIAPAALLIGLFFLVPAVWAVSVSTTPLTLLGATAGSTEFVGLQNYRQIIDDPDFFKYVWNTIVFTVGTAVIGATGGGLAIALLIDHAQARGHRLATIAFGAVVLAGVCPPTLAGSIWGSMLDYRTGMLNGALSVAGIESIDMLGDFPMLSVVIAESWRIVALAMIVFYGALQTVPKSIYEAAHLDGASSWRVLLDITLPILRQLVALVLLMTTIMATGSFLLNQVLTGGGTSKQTETIALYAYHMAFTDFRIGFGAALSVVILGVTAVFAAIYLRIARVAS
ncbi:sugar ABC transporter permease [soil metagenome]